MKTDLDDQNFFSEPALLILISLADGTKHGYAMIEDIEQIAGVKVGSGTLYGALARLENQGLIEAVASGDRRRPYKLTLSGVTVLKKQLNNLGKIAYTGLQRLKTT